MQADPGDPGEPGQVHNGSYRPRPLTNRHPSGPYAGSRTERFGQRIARPAPSPVNALIILWKAGTTGAIQTVAALQQAPEIDSRSREKAHLAIASASPLRPTCVS